MKIWITKQPHHKYNYLMHWENPENGMVFYDWFRTLKEISEYTANWGVT